MLKMMIGNEEVVCDKNIIIKEEMLSASSTILNNCYPKSWENDKDYVSRFYYPQDYSKCTIERIENGSSELIFSGIVKNTSDISLNPREPKYCSIQILSYKTLLSEGDTLDFVISNKTINEAIQMVVDSVSKYGFVLGNVNILNGDEVIGAYSTLNKTAYDVFQYLAEISGAKWQTRVIDDTTLAIDFYDPTLMPKGTTIEYSKEWAESNNLVDLKFKYGTYDYRNKQIMLSSEMFGDITYNEKFVANGYSYEYVTADRIGRVTSIKVNGIEKTIADEVEKDNGVYANFYYKSGDTSFTQNTSDSILAPGSVIQLEYTPIINGREIISNADEIDRVANQLGVNGVISRYEERNDVTDSNQLISIGSTYLKYKGEAEIILTITTHNNNLYEVGQVVDFIAPIGNLSKQYLVKSKEINILAVGNGTWELFYTYELSSTFNGEKAINWFDNQRNKSQGNITEGSYINRNIDIESTANIIWDNLQVQEVEVDETYPAENTLDSVIETIIE